MSCLFFKPFGWIDLETGNKRLGEIFIINKDRLPLLKLQGRKGNTKLKVTIVSLDLLKKSFHDKKIKNLHDAKFKIDCQITKYQICMGCLGCTSACKYDAIKIRKRINETYDNEIAITNDNNTILDQTEYIIDDEKCIRCTKCVDHFDNGCYMKKVTRVKRSE